MVDIMEIRDKKFHFIAIGGVGMSALAKYLVECGATVSGSDIQESKYTHLLEKLGIKVSIGHNADLIEKDMIITASSAIKETNPEIIRAKELGLKIYHRSDILKMISDEFSARENAFFIGFSGTHGKTTTSGLASYVLYNAGLNPSFVTGGIIPDINTNGNYNGDKYFIAELDESDGTIEKYSTDAAVINNMDEDHLDHYKNGFDDIADTFNKYLSNKPNQKVIINIDNEGNQKFIKKYPKYNYITFGLRNADYTAENIKYEGFGSEFEVYFKGKFETKLKLSIIGEHNIYNALAVYASLNETGIKVNELTKYFESFSGMGRRFQKTGEFNGIKLFDDYAHHPHEIMTTLEGIHKASETNRVVAIFQPHRYTRLNALWEEFKNAFENADLLIATNVYPAGESEIQGVNSENFIKEVNHSNAIFISGDMCECAKKIYPLLKNNDIVITLGAGDITKLGGLISEEHKRVCLDANIK